MLLLTSCLDALETHDQLFLVFTSANFREKVLAEFSSLILFSKLVSSGTLAAQLQEIPEDFFDDSLSSNSFLRPALKVCIFFLSIRPADLM